jgi:hypothetical protein
MAQQPPSKFSAILKSQPTDINFLMTNRFRLVIPRCPHVVYWVQQVNLPGFSIGTAAQPTTFIELPIPDDRLHYNDLVVSFPVDELMMNYKEIADWIIGLGFPKQFGQYKDLYESTFGLESDIGIMILDSEQQIQHMVKFVNAFPVSITDINFDTKPQDTVIPMVTATFKYHYWQFDEVNAGTTTLTQADDEHVD